MKKVKTIAALVLTLVMAVSMASCGSPAPEETKAPTAAEAAAEAATRAPAGDVPSVTRQAAPVLNGSFVIREMAGENADLVNDKVVAEVPAEALHVTGFHARNEAAEEIKVSLEHAYKAIAAAEDLTVLSEDVTAAAGACGLNVDELVVRDLLDITLDEAFDKILAEERTYIVLTFSLDLAEDEAVFVLHGLEEGAWETVYGDSILREEDGRVSVVLNSLCPVAFVVRSAG